MLQKRSEDERREMFFKLSYVEQHLSGIATMDIKLLQFNVTTIQSNVTMLESSSNHLVQSIHDLNRLVVSSTAKKGVADELGNE